MKTIDIGFDRRTVFENAVLFLLVYLRMKRNPPKRINLQARYRTPVIF